MQELAMGKKITKITIDFRIRRDRVLAVIV
jgi:hypothetical protein